MNFHSGLAGSQAVRKSWHFLSVCFPQEKLGSLPKQQLNKNILNSSIQLLKSCYPTSCSTHGTENGIWYSKDINGKRRKGRASSQTHSLHNAKDFLLCVICLSVGPLPTAVTQWQKTACSLNTRSGLLIYGSTARRKESVKTEHCECLLLQPGLAVLFADLSHIF